MENEATGGLTEEQLQEAEEIIDPEGAQAIRVASISKKGQWREVKKVVDLSDVIL
jgi:nuclear GTP-binding protein